MLNNVFNVFNNHINISQIPHGMRSPNSPRIYWTSTEILNMFYAIYTFTKSWSKRDYYGKLVDIGKLCKKLRMRFMILILVDLW